MTVSSVATIAVPLFHSYEMLVIYAATFGLYMCE